MHRDRRVELFQAQARVTELYLRNLSRRLDDLKREAGQFKPYSSDPNAKPIDPSLVTEIGETENAIDRHEQNLRKFRQEERQIIERFNGDIQRFRRLKGIDQSCSNSPGVTETAVAAIAVGELIYDFETHLLDGHEHHLCDALRRLHLVAL